MINEKIENQIKELMKKLHLITTKNNKYYFEAYTLLKQIYDLRCSQIEDYTISDLAREKGIDFPVRTLRAIFEFEHMTEKTKKLLKSGKLTHSAYKTLISYNTDFRKPVLQNKVVEKYLNKEITLNNMTHCSGHKLKGMIEKGETITQREKDKNEVEYHLKQIAYRLGKDKTILNEIRREYKDDKGIFEIIGLVKKNYIGKCPKCFTELYRKDIK